MGVKFRAEHFTARHAREHFQFPGSHREWLWGLGTAPGIRSCPLGLALFPPVQGGCSEHLLQGRSEGETGPSLQQGLEQGKAPGECYVNV